MSFFVQPTNPPAPKNVSVWYSGIALAAIFILLAVSQLYSYEDYPDVIASLGLYGGRFSADLYAALFVVGEVVAVPFLLSMRLSCAMRIVSMMAGWGVVAAWAFISVLTTVTANAITNVGVLGATIPVAPEWWMVVVWIVIAMICAWISWGMWPLGRKGVIDSESE
jgi:hypothetical protein